jgi:UDP-N-acetylglucosamine/UDP-N-acetylgalactosamine 4-epimerase
MDRYKAVLAKLRQTPRTWLVTGVAGFIGSHLLECLLSLGQSVIGLDNFSTGHPKNVDEAMERGAVHARFRLIYGDARELGVCQEACKGVDVVLHHAALASVPGSIADPLACHAANVDGFANLLVAARDAKVKRFVYASSSAVYGDDPASPKREERIGAPLSPYAATKGVNEIYAAVFQRVYGLQTFGLRYFNVFGRRQDPQGPYAAVIPQWVSTLAAGKPCVINGDGETTRDFFHVDDVVQANLLAAGSEGESETSHVYNVAGGQPTTLNQLYAIIRAKLVERLNFTPPDAVYADFRPGDIRRSVADVSKISRDLGYVPGRTVDEGIDEAINWYLANDTPPRAQRKVDQTAGYTPPLSLITPRTG